MGSVAARSILASLIAVLPWLAACGGAAAPAPPPTISSTAPPVDTAFACPPDDQLAQLAVMQSEYQEAPEIGEGASADIEEAGGEHLGNGTFTDLDGDGDLDLLIGMCIHEDCSGSVMVDCGGAGYAQVWSGDASLSLGTGTTELGGVRWRNLERSNGGIADDCYTVDTMVFDGKEYVLGDGEPRQECY